MKTFTINFTDFAKDTLLRTNFKTIFTGIKIQEKIDKKSIKFIRLKEEFYILSGYAFKSEDYVEYGIPLIRISDVENTFNKKQMVFLPEEYKEKYKNYLLKKDDIIVSLTGDGKIKSDLVKEQNKFLLNQRVGVLRPKQDNLNIKFYYYLINNLVLVKEQFYWYSNGKTQLNISPFDLLKIKIPQIPKQTQDKIVSQIEPIENEIKELKSQIKDSQEIINKVFAREFGFDLEKFEESKKEKFFEVSFSDFANNKDLRQSVKFHRKSAKFVYKELKNITNTKIKYYISEPIVLGKGISPKNYDENGEFYYISMANIKNWRFEKSNCRLVSIYFSDKNKNKTVKKNDILIARSGEGTIGKVSLIEDDSIKGIFADFIIRIRLLNYNPLFVYYYFRTEYFQYLIEINKKGLGNNTNIFPSQIQEFPIPNIPLPRQQEIVDEIKKELDKQEEIKKQIEEKRDKIDKIVEEVVK